MCVAEVQPRGQQCTPTLCRGGRSLPITRKRINSATLLLMVVAWPPSATVPGTCAASKIRKSMLQLNEWPAQAMQPRLAYQLGAAAQTVHLPTRLPCPRYLCPEVGQDLGSVQGALISLHERLPAASWPGRSSSSAKPNLSTSTSPPLLAVPASSPSVSSVSSAVNTAVTSWPPTGGAVTSFVSDSASDDTRGIHVA